jgi:N-acetylglucosaminyl-diphospho-decaprenol L-rhamnosyltransferase
VVDAHLLLPLAAGGLAWKKRRSYAIADRMSQISVAIINYNTRHVLRACLVSAIADGATDIVVADNGSTDGSLEMLRQEFTTATVLVDGSNPGYGGASNAAIERCRFEYVLLLNSDTVLYPGALGTLRDYLDAHPRVAILGPRLRNPDGTLQRSLHQFPTPLVTLLDYSWVGPFVGLIPGLRKLYLASDSHEHARAVPWVTGAALALRKSAFQAVGGFDPSFFMYYEEVDLSYRLHRAGWETHFTPEAEVTHVGGASTSQIRGAMYAQQLAAALQYSERHQSRLSVALTSLALRFGIACRLAGDTVRLAVTRDHARRQYLEGSTAILRSIVRAPWRAAER